MSQHKWVGTLLLIALSSASTAFAIEGVGGDKDVSRGSNRDDIRFSNEQQSRGTYYQDDEMRARHQRARDDDAGRRYSRDFDVQGKMNN